jgi:hypothetical protein
MASRYDKKTETLWVKSLATGDDLVPNDEIREWVNALKRGRTPEGQPVRRINYVFQDPRAAEYNHQALRFAKLGTYVGDLVENEPYESAEDVEFTTEEDFGIEE